MGISNHSVSVSGVEEETPDRLSTRPSWLITQLSTHVRRMVTDGFADADVRGYHYRLLAALQEFGPASQADLGRQCRIDRSDVVQAINELAGDGLVERTADPTDGRRNIVTVTTAGKRRLRKLDRVLDRVQGEVLAPLSGAEREVLTDTLRRLLDHHDAIQP